MPHDTSSLSLTHFLPVPVACRIFILVRVLVPVGLHGELHSENSVHWLGTQSPGAMKETFKNNVEFQTNFSIWGLA